MLSLVVVLLQKKHSINIKWMDGVLDSELSNDTRMVGHIYSLYKWNEFKNNPVAGMGWRLGLQMK